MPTRTVAATRVLWLLCPDCLSGLGVVTDSNVDSQVVAVPCAADLAYNAPAAVRIHSCPAALLRTLCRSFASPSAPATASTTRSSAQP